jgi:hypothetical protein
VDDYDDLRSFPVSNFCASGFRFMLVTAKATGYAEQAARRLQPLLHYGTFVFCPELRSVYLSCPDLST